MKRNILSVLGAIAILSLGSIGIISLDSHSAALASPATATAKQSGQQSDLEATFVSGRYSTEGTVRVVREDGKRYLEFDGDFKTNSGPDLFVLLHDSEKPERYNEEDYISLGRLEKISGTQRYAIPEDEDLDSYASVVIWCRRFNVTFGYASF
ncbi:MAG: DM13 domain-containing protein [Oscillatoria sp. SIO1A7]|nr:DM13 domain-containing protein [Oscillatoria sp. SIO1A7]